MLSSLISQLQMLIDRIFIGRLSLESMSAVGNATTPMWTTLNVMYSLTTGATILVSQAYGAGDDAKGRTVLASLFKYNNAAGLFLFLFWTFCSQTAFSLMGVDESIIGMSIDYAKYFAPIFLFEGIGVSITCLLSVSQKTQIMIWYGLSRSLANVILDYAMIFGHFGFPAMGVKGAALATAIAELLGHIIIFIYALRSKELKLRPGLSEILSSGIGPYIGTIKLGAPAAGEEFA